jgi:flagellar basal-body rod modification protein FlgD
MAPPSVRQATGTTPLLARTAVAYQQAAWQPPPAPPPEAQADRFLKLLVAQLQNQDPMNPMDNAQMTSQMAQINTVSRHREAQRPPSRSR